MVERNQGFQLSAGSKEIPSSKAVTFHTYCPLIITAWYTSHTYLAQKEVWLAWAYVTQERNKKKRVLTWHYRKSNSTKQKEKCEKTARQKWKENAKWDVLKPRARCKGEEGSQMRENFQKNRLKFENNKIHNVRLRMKKRIVLKR